MKRMQTLRRTETTEQIRELIAGVPGCLMVADEIKPEHRLRDHLGLDSLAMVDLMICVEDAFNIFFDPVQTDLTIVFETVDSLSSYVDSLISA